MSSVSCTFWETLFLANTIIYREIQNLEDKFNGKRMKINDTVIGLLKPG